MMARIVVLALAGLACSAGWLTLLVTSRFSSVAASVGLLGMLSLLSSQQ